MTVNASSYLSEVYARAQALAGHQSTVLMCCAAVIMAVAMLYVLRGRVFGYYYPVVDEDGEPTGEKRVGYRDGYYRLHGLLTVAGLLAGGFATYAGLYLGWTRQADPFTLVLLFIGGASTMHLGGRTWRWAWLVAPVLSGIGVSQLWGLLEASPSTTISLGATLALMAPTFIGLLYVENAHGFLGTFMVRFRLAFIVGGLMIAQAVALWAGVSLWLPVQQGIANILSRIGGT